MRSRALEAADGGLGAARAYAREGRLRFRDAFHQRAVVAAAIEEPPDLALV
jgi:hypothetical protein